MRQHGWASSPTRAHIPNHIRAYVMRRDSGECKVQWGSGCTRIATQLDHLVSPLDGGTDTAPNLRGSCAWCNARRNEATRPRRPSSRRPKPGPPGLIR